MFRFLVPATALLAALAVAARTEPRAALGAPPMQWTLTHEGDVAKLAYGVPRSDHLAMMLTCAPGEAVAVHGPLRPDSPAARPSIGAGAGSDGPIDPLSGELLQDVRLPAADQALVGLAAGHALPVVSDLDDRGLIPAGEGGRRLAGAFLAHCASART